VSDLGAFLAARLDEDEAAAREWHERRCDGCGQRVAARGLYGLVKCITCEPGDLPFSAERPRREVATKRAILAAHKNDRNPRDEWYGGDVRCEECGYEGGNVNTGLRAIQRSWPCRTLRAVAAVYSDHADYDPEWKPT
jgi:hypothetical protein